MMCNIPASDCVKTSRPSSYIFHQQCWWFNGVYINSKASLTLETFVCIYPTHAAFICISNPNPPNSQNTLLYTRCKNNFSNVNK